MNKTITKPGKYTVEVAKNNLLNLHVLQKEKQAGDFNITLNLSGNNAQVVVSYAFMGGESDQQKATLNINHLTPHTRADVKIKGILKDQARHWFDGKIFVAPGAHHTESFLEHRTLLLSNTAKVSTTPALEILNNDVKASHAATVSHLDSEQLFFAQSRGLKKKVAEKIIIDSFLSEVQS